MHITVANRKGGTAKTTTAVHLAAGLAERGPTVLVDADPQLSALNWAQDADGLRFSVVTPDELEGLDSEWDHVVVDTPPHDAGILHRAIAMADIVVVPLAPSLVELRQLRPTREVIQEARQQNSGLREAYLLTRVRAGTRSSRFVREALVALGLPVCRAEIALRESVAAGFGATPDLGAYRPVLEELIAE